MKTPIAIKGFLKAVEEKNTDALLASFTQSAVLKDMGHTHQGRDLIKNWSDRQFIGADVSLINLAQKAGEESFVVTARVDGDFKSFGVNDPFTLDFSFELAGTKIASLVMTERKELDALPQPVADFLDATRRYDFEALQKTLSNDFVLTDWGKTYKSSSELKDFNDTLFMGAKITLDVEKIQVRGETAAVTVMVDGDYKKYDITEPFELDYIFTVRDGKISALNIIENK